MMRAPLALLLALGIAGTAWSKSAQEYFHGSAYKFVAGRQQEALIQAEEGLNRFPDDAALKTLVVHLRKLKDQQKQDQGSQGSSQGDEGKKQDQKKDESQGGGDKGKEDQDKPKPGEEEDKGEDGKDKGQEGQGEEKDKQDGKEGKDGEDSASGDMVPVKPGEMSKEDADRLLNSIQDDEKKEHKQQQRRHRKRPEVEQDW